VVLCTFEGVRRASDPEPRAKQAAVLRAKQAAVLAEEIGRSNRDLLDVALP